MNYKKIDLSKYIEVIDQARKDKGMTVAELCTKCGIGETTYFLAKKNNTDISMRKYIALCVVVNINPFNLD